MKNIFIVCLAFCFSSVYCQQEAKKPVTPLNIGDKVPDLHFYNMINSKAQRAKLSDYDGKLVILDFWATWCTACIGKFEKLDSLQKQHSDKLAIILVTQDSKKNAEKLFEKQYTTKGHKYTLPSVTDDSVMVYLFRHRLIPHYVWILDSRVVAFTAPEEVTTENIEAVYKKRAVRMRMKNDVLDFEKEKPLFVNGNGGNGNNILYRSILTAHTDGLSAGYFQDAKGTMVTRLSVRNQTLLQLYMFAYGKPFVKSRILLEVKDQDKFINKNNSPNWEYDNLYCYEIIVPPMSRKEILARVRSDLFIAFGYTPSVQTRKIKCFVLKRDTTDGAVKNQDVPATDERMGIKKFKNSLHLGEVVESMLNVPVIDESDYSNQFEVKMPRGPVQLKDMEAALKGAGFSLVQAEREVEVFVVSETGMP